MDVFAVLADPTRRDILSLLKQRERSVGELVDAIGLYQPGISRHLRVLHDAGLVQARREAQRRVYHLHPAGFKEVAEWLRFYEDHWRQSLDGLERMFREKRNMKE